MMNKPNHLYYRPNVKKERKVKDECVKCVHHLLIAATSVPVLVSDAAVAVALDCNNGCTNWRLSNRFKTVFKRENNKL